MGAQVKGVNSDTNVATAATTSGTGDFVLPFLTPGPYNLEVDMKGFRKHLEQHIDVLADDKVTINVKLELGSASQSIEVTSAEG